MTDDVVRFLDDFRAAESASVEVLRAWIDVCQLDGLRGGLRTIAGREAAHAVLAAERLAELGAPATASVPEEVRAAAVARFGSPSVPDEEKIALVLARYPDDASSTREIAALAARLADDPETRELLRLIAEGEAATVAWLRAYHAGLSRRGGAGRPPATPDRGA
ncbi:MAG TPA: hypothetical protein VFD84_04320 [Candidatus Binatia bacterium]|jgi:hypothetical protein|nr:hypothetical protein [Candidatus Binatia bacterium]